MLAEIGTAATVQAYLGGEQASQGPALRGVLVERRGATARAVQSLGLCGLARDGTGKVAIVKLRPVAGDDACAVAATIHLAKLLVSASAALISM
ncbi:MAG: hypothetical protein CMP81_07205 [Fulvimarina sp.]|nr:hypothetical protein [Fulvimarina sp.]